MPSAKITRLRFSGFTLEEVMNGADEKEAFTINSSETSADGTLLRSVDYDSDGNEIEKIENKLDEKGRITEQKHYYEGELAETVVFEYDVNSLPVKETKRYADGGEEEVQTTYNADNRVTERKFIGSEGEVERREAFRFEGKMMVEQCKYGENDSLTEKLTFRYEKIGEEMEPVEIKHFSADTGHETVTKYTYTDSGMLTGSLTYDRSNKCVEKQTLSYDERKRETGNLIETPGRTVHRRTVYDDEKGTIISERYVDGMLVSHTEEKRNAKDELLFIHTREPELGIFTDKITRQEL